MEEFRSKLDTRKLTPEIMKCSEMLDEKDIVIDKNKEEIIELKKIIGLKESSNSNWIILRDEQAQRIYSMVIQDKENNSSSEFAIEHDGHYVLGIENLN